MGRRHRRQVTVVARYGQAALAATRDLPLESALDYLQAQLALAFTTEDLAEGVLAFKEKRSPQWRNA